MSDLVAQSPSGHSVLLKADASGDLMTADIAATTATGSITTQNLVPAGVATANSAVEIDTHGASTLTFQITGVYTGAISLQLTVDGVTWVTLGGIPINNLATGAMSANVASAVVGIFQADVAGAARARLTGLAAVTGSANVTIVAAHEAAMIGLDSGVVMMSAAGTQLTFLGDTTDAVVGNAAASKAAVVSRDSKWNGATWDRDRKSNAIARLLSAAATTNAANIKASAGDLWHIRGYNAAATAKFLKIYNKATAPTVGTDVPVLTYRLLPTSIFDIDLDGHYLGTGIGYAITGAPADNDTTALAAGDVTELVITFA